MAATSPADILMPPPEPPKGLRIGIIGGGPGGLMAAYRLEKQLPVGASVTVFEASPRVGGKILAGTFSQAPVPYEAGAAELYDYSPLGPDPLRELIAELGLSAVPLSGGAIVLNDRLCLTAADVDRELGPPAARALRVFRRRARGLVSAAEYYQSDWDQAGADAPDRQSFHDLLATVPDPAARSYLQLLTHSDLACEPGETTAEYGLQNYLMDEPDYLRLYTLQGGIERLPQELARRLSARVLLDHRVTRVEQTGPGTYRISALCGRRTVEQDFDFVVVALPNNWIPAISWGGAALAAAMYEHHRHYSHPAHYLRVSLLFDRPFWRDEMPDSYFMLDAFGGCCVYDESARAEGSTHGVLGWLLAGDAALNFSNSNDATLIATVLDALPGFMRHGRKHYLEGRVHRWVGSVNGLPGGVPARDPAARHQPEPLAHSRVLVVGDYLFDSTLNGVLDSADVAVDLILDEIAPAAGDGALAAAGPPGAPS
jgi:monoamine oxidase